ncbi:hypothetical protein C6P45_001708 [Maudiozyma exigua]|uniref:Choline kinase N-terminal domain-containing protein n=1 Tax=Maudiozyma exigua TaxID=34358 RepID=A0A9P6VZ58_MAUEX|nr:hypothetical protein C6P45_001708 [Kazachstania exigua]
MTNSTTIYQDYKFDPKHPEQLIPYLTNNNTSTNYKISILRIEGALTNVIYKASLLDHNGISTDQDFLIRIYDAKNDNIIDRENELTNLKRLPESFDKIKILFHFQNGRIENFLNNYRAIKSNEMSEHHNLRKIAHRFKELHSLTNLTPEEKQHYGSNGKKPKYHCFCWDTIFNWLDTINQYRNWLTERNNENVCKNLLCKDWSTFKRIVHNYRDWLVINDSDSFKNIALCHNDTQHGNIMIERDTDNKADIIFIDFEYGGINTISFDLANFLTECMNDYEAEDSAFCDSEKFPTSTQTMHFIKSYLTYLEPTDLNQLQQKQLYNSLLKWRSSSQLFWSIWAILQSGELNNENIDQTGRFQYLNFAQSKMSLFWNDMIKLGIASNDDCVIERVRDMELNLL